MYVLVCHDPSCCLRDASSVSLRCIVIVLAHTTFHDGEIPRLLVGTEALQLYSGDAKLNCVVAQQDLAISRSCNPLSHSCQLEGSVATAVTTAAINAATLPQQQPKPNAQASLRYLMVAMFHQHDRSHSSHITAARQLRYDRCLHPTVAMRCC